MNLRQSIFCLFFLICLLIGLNIARANVFDELKGGTETFTGFCSIQGRVEMPCIEVTNNNKLYILFIDRKGIVAIYQKIHEKFVLIWAKTLL